MPQASCNTCIQNIYSTDIQICDCNADAPKSDCTHWNRHHRDIDDLCTSALNGCRMCSELWRYFFKEKTPEQYLAGALPGVDPGRGFLIGPTVHVFVCSGTSFRVVELGGGEERDGVSAGGEAGEGLLLALDFSINSPMIYEVEERRYVLRKTSDYQRLVMLFMSGLLRVGGDGDGSEHVSEKRWDWVRTWMADCADEERHRLCSRALKAVEASSYLPTRVIESTPFVDQDGKKRYRLLETGTLGTAGRRYATLSHIWGQDQSPLYRTVRSNYTTRLSGGVLRDELPACFQDAIDVAEKLDIPYIWIDSLCIIQDDDIDCPTEAGQMDQVYSNSFLNLSATASSTSKDRLPSMARADHLQEPRFVGTVWSGRCRGNYQIFDPHFWSDRVTSTRLASRGWIFQERALAPRVLHFGFDQVLWECAESERAEEFPRGLPLRSPAASRQGFKWDLNTDPLQNAKASYETATVVADSAQTDFSILDRKWSAVISEYSRCELTKPKDKLIAISGVAKLLARRFNDTYIAGLWHSNLVGGLCWRVPKMRRTTQNLVPSGLYARRWEVSRRLQGNGAPSWSWASVDGEIEPGPFQSENEAHGVRFYVESGHVGYAVCASLLRSAPSVEVVLKSELNGFGEVDTEQTLLMLHGTVYKLELCRAASGVGFMFRHVGVEEGLRVYLDEPEDEGVEGARFLPLVQIKHFIHGAGGQKHGLDRVIGIVVVPVEGAGVYRRIGLHECQAYVLEHLEGKVECVSLR